MSGEIVPIGDGELLPPEAEITKCGLGVTDPRTMQSAPCVSDAHLVVTVHILGCAPGIPNEATFATCGLHAEIAFSKLITDLSGGKL